MNDLTPVDPVAMTIFIAFFVLVTVVGFFAARWKRGDLTQLHEWGLGGRQFGVLISWFLVGGDFYTAYTVIAVPALVYSVGAYGFFALPYTIIVYPFVFAVMPKLWKIAHAKDHITAADYVHGEYGGKWLPAAVALTGIVATMPYIALQLVGMQVVIKGLGVTGELPLIIAFVILALYTYTSGLRAPAMIAFVKDIMIYIVVIAAGVHVKSASDVVPTLFGTLFPSWFIGFAAAAIAISALVPAAIMSIGAANLFTRNLWRPLFSPDMTSASEASTAKLVSLVVKFGALLFIVFLPTQYAIDLQLLGGVWILQIFPAIVFSLYTRRLTTPGLFLGWLCGIVLGTGLAISQGLKPVYALHVGDATWPTYIGLIALVVNIVVTYAVSLVTRRSVVPAV